MTNIVRGLPLELPAGAPAGASEFTGSLLTLLNPMSLLGGVVVVALSLTHGAFFTALKTDGAIRAEAREVGTKVGVVTALLAVVLLLWLGITQGTLWSWLTTGIAAVMLLVGIWFNIQGPATRGPVAALGAVGLLQGLTTIALVFVLAQVVVEVVLGAEIARPALLLVALFAARALLAYLAESVQAWAGVGVASALRERLIDHWLSTPADARPDPARAGTLAAQGCTAVEPYAARFLPSLIHAAVVPLLAMISIAVVDWSSALIVLLTVPLLPLFAALIGARTAADTDKRWRALSGLAGHFIDVMRGLPTLVSYGLMFRS